MREIPLKPYKPKKRNKLLCVMDTETDPFSSGKVVEPFTLGFYIVDTKEYFDFWGDDCVAQFFQFLEDWYSDYELLIYAHNGGNFDFYFCLDYLDSGSKPFLINGRIVRIFMGGQEFRDSYSAIPVALGEYNKTPIDYSKMERGNREANKDEILAYQKDDCVFLGELIEAWLDQFGDKLTMASVALPMLRCFHGFEEITEETDNMIRPFYFGGRTQAFETGELHDDWKIYDVNSMYPFVMASTMHPVSAIPIPSDRLTERTSFARILAYSNGCLPIRGDNGSLHFPCGEYEFFATGHEIQAGLDTQTLRILEVREAYEYEVLSDFEGFVNHYYTQRLEAKERGDAINTLFLKLVLNSAYGKLAQDSRKYCDYLFDPDRLPKPLFCAGCFEKEQSNNEHDKCSDCLSGNTSAYGWQIEHTRNGRHIWAKPQVFIGKDGKPFAKGFFNVATAASITGAARAYLWRAIFEADRPIYCDTDSIICRGLGSTYHLGEKRLGAWKTEAEGDVAYIAGKKLYAVFNQGKEIKKASKGVRLTAEQIARVAAGEVVEYANPVPRFSFDGGAKFVTRNIRKTG